LRLGLTIITVDVVALWALGAHGGRRLETA